MSKQIPEVTIAIVFYNAMPYLRDCMASVFQQTHAEWELLLLDDGSTDGTLAYARTLTDPRIRLISDGSHLALNRRLNQSIHLARGRFYFRMDADDIMFPDRIECQLKVLKSLSREDAVVGGQAVSIDENNQVRGLRRPAAAVKRPRQALGSFIHPTVAGPTAWFRRNPYDESTLYHRSQDAELWLRTWRQCHFINLPRPLIYYREPSALNLDNYIATSMGLCALGQQQEKYAIKAGWWWITRDLLKLWLVLLLTRLGGGHRLLRWRSRSFDAVTKARYQEILNAVTR